MGTKGTELGRGWGIEGIRRTKWRKTKTAKVEDGLQTRRSLTTALAEVGSYQRQRVGG